MGRYVEEMTVMASPTLTRHEDIVKAAIYDWNNGEEGGGYSSAEAGYPKMYPLMTEAQRSRLWNNDKVEVSSGQSAIFPNVDKSSIKTSTKRVKLSLSGELVSELSRNVIGSQQELLNILAQQFGETVSEAEIVKLPARRKPVAVTTEGKAITVYQVWGVAERSNHLLADDILSQSEARAKALELADNPKITMGGFAQEYEAFEVRPYIRRNSGDVAVVRVSRPVPESATVEVKVTFAEIKPDSKIVSYDVSFTVHH